MRIRVGLAWFRAAVSMDGKLVKVENSTTTTTIHSTARTRQNIHKNGQLSN